MAYLRLVVCSLFFFFTSAVSGQDEWVLGGSGVFSDDNNWLDGTAPQTDESVLFDVAGTYVVTFTGGATTPGFVVDQGNVSFQSSGGVHTYTAQSFLPGFGGPTGTLTMNGGMLTLGTSGNPFNVVSGPVTLASSAVLNITNGSVLTFNRNFGASGQDIGPGDLTIDGTLLVDGAGSTLTEGFVIGTFLNGNDHNANYFIDGSLTFQNNATGFLEDGSTSVTGTLNVLSGAGVQASQVLVNGGNVIVDGAGTILDVTLLSSGKFSNGSPFAEGTINVSSGNLDVSNGAALLANEVFIFSTGVINVGVVGTGGLTVGLGELEVFGTLNVGSGGALSLGGLLDIRSGGLVSFAKSYATTNNVQIGGTLETTAGSSLTLSNAVTMTGGSVLDVSGNLNVATLTATSAQLNSFGGMIDVDGNTSVGANGSQGSISLNGGSAQLGAINIALAGGSGEIIVDGANVQAESIDVGTDDSSFASGTMSIIHAQVSVTGVGAITVGGMTDSSGVVNITSGGLTAGAGGTVLNEEGRIVINQGFVELGQLTFNGGQIDFFSGDLSLIGDIVISESGVFGEDILELDDHELLVEGTTTVDTFAAMVVNGAFIETSGLVINGAVYMNEGLLKVTDLAGLTVGGQGLSSLLQIGANRPSVVSVAETAFVGTGSAIVVQGGRLDAGSMQIFGVTSISGGAVNVLNTALVNPGGSLTLSNGIFTSNSLENSGLVSLAGSTMIVASGLINQTGATFVVGPAGVTAINGISSNAGDILLTGGSARLSGSDPLTNNGLLRGDGTISKPVINAASGEIRAASGQNLRFEDAGGANAGRINLQGGTIEFLQPLTNSATGLITGRGTLNTGGVGLTNQGSMAFSAGISDVFGDVDNTTGARIIISGGATVNFWDDVIHNGTEIKVAQGASAVFFGSTSGAGPFTGTGQVFMEGDLSPGNSPAAVNFGGDLHFGALASLQSEVGGMLAGSQYDQVLVQGTATLDGTLNVLLTNGFVPAPGDTFEIFSAASIVGTFSSASLPNLPGSLEWVLNYTPTSVELISTFAGDFDLDGDVDGRDFLVWQRNPNVGSLTSWQQQYGTNPALAASRAVPEPAGLVSILLLTISIKLSRRHTCLWVPSTA